MLIQLFHKFKNMTKPDTKISLTAFEELYKKNRPAFCQKATELKSQLANNTPIAFHSDEYEVKEGDRFTDAAQFKKWIKENFPMEEDEIIDM
jgi:hypothetical protein